MWTNTYSVSCRSCELRHDTKFVQFVDIEEDIDGRDIMTFSCPNTGEIVKSWVTRDNISAFAF